jgi:hypothetical protein
MIDSNGDVVVSASTLRDVATCTTADVMRHGFEWTGKDTTGARTLGQVVHEVMEHYVVTGGNVEETLALFKAAYKPFSDEVCLPVEKKRAGKTYLDPNRCRYENASVVLSEWLSAHPLSALPYDVLHTELPFNEELARGVRYRGRIDALVQKDGRWWVLDFKTTGRLDEAFWKQYRMDAALAGYVWAAERLTGGPIAGVIIEGIEMSEVPSSTRKCGDHGVPYAECGRMHVSWGYREYERDPQQIGKWALDAQRLSIRHRLNMNDILLENAEQEGQFHGACYKYEGFAKCDFAEFCEAGRHLDNAEVYGLEEVEEH